MSAPKNPVDYLTDVVLQALSERGTAAAVQAVMNPQEVDLEPHPSMCEHAIEQLVLSAKRVADAAPAEASEQDQDNTSSLLGAIAFSTSLGCVAERAALTTGKRGMASCGVVLPQSHGVFLVRDPVLVEKVADLLGGDVIRVPKE